MTNQAKNVRCHCGQTKEHHWVSPEGNLILLFSLLLSLVLLHCCPYLSLLGIVWFLFCVYFFRNPKRVSPKEEGVLLSPADGVVIVDELVTEPHFLHIPMRKISVFMSPFNVHVNRNAVSGVVQDKTELAGRFKAAFDKDASEKNERVAVWLRTKEGHDVVMVQIAGWFARRIVNYLKAGDVVAAGNIFGVIKFGSRVDLYFPDDYRVVVLLKQKVRAGETLLARKKSEA